MDKGEGVTQCGIFEKGCQFLAILCGRLLWTAPKLSKNLDQNVTKIFF